MRFWRISEHNDLSGKGGIFSNMRWNHLGTLIVYCAEHPALAMLEIIVNIDREDLPSEYQLLEIEGPDNVKIIDVKLPPNWQDDEQVTRNIWQRFVEKNEACLLRVPSIVMPHAFNILVNPLHSDHDKLKIMSQTQHPFDARFVD